MQKRKTDHKTGILVLILTLLRFFGIPLVLYWILADTFNLGGYIAACLLFELAYWLVKLFLGGFF